MGESVAGDSDAFTLEAGHFAGGEVVGGGGEGNCRGVVVV